MERATGTRTLRAMRPPAALAYRRDRNTAALTLVRNVNEIDINQNVGGPVVGSSVSSPAMGTRYTA